MKQFFLTQAVIILTLNHAFAQLGYYDYSQSISNYQEITDGFVLGAGTNLSNYLWTEPTTETNNSGIGPGFDLGFDFKFRGVIYNRFGVARSGFIFLGQSAKGNEAVDVTGTFSNIYVPSDINDTLRSTISAFAAGIVGQNTNASMAYKLIGQAPSRTLVIQWKNYKLVGIGYPNTTNLNFQIRLNETDNSIELKYGTMAFTNYNWFDDLKIGIWGFNQSDFSNRIVSGTNDMNATSSGPLYDSHIALSTNTIPPSSGLTLKWTPPILYPPIDVLQQEIDDTQVSLSWHRPIDFLNGNYEYALTDTIADPESGIVTDSLFCQVNNLTPGTFYYFHLRSRINPMVHSQWHTIKIKTLCSPPLLPFYENFDGYDVDEDLLCYSTFNDAEYFKIKKVSEFGAFNNKGIIFSNVEAEDDDWLMLPPLRVEPNKNYFISFDYNDTNFELYKSSSPNIASMEYFDASTIQNSNYPNEINHQYYKFFHTTILDTLYFAIKAQGGHLLDEMEFGEYLCDPPYNIAHTLMGDSLLITWESDFSDSVEIELVNNENYYPFENTSFHSGDSILFTNVNLGSNYFFNIRGLCSTKSAWQTYPFALPPQNDKCINAITLIPATILEDYSVSGSTIGATNENPTACLGNPNDDIWYKFTATSRSHGIVFGIYGGCGEDISPNCVDVVIELHAHDCNGPILKCILADSLHTFYVNEVFTDLHIDSTYYLRIFSKGSSSFVFNYLNIYTYFPAQNDNCSSAELFENIQPICSMPLYGNLANTNASYDTIGVCNGGPYYDLWYKFAATDSIQIIQAQFDSGVNGVIQVMSNTCGNFNQIVCVDNSTIGSEIAVIENLNIGDTIYFRIFDANGVGPYSNTEVCVKKLNENDQCNGALSITQTANTPLNNFFIDNTLSSTGNATCSSFYADDDLWYKFTAIDTFALISVMPVFPNPILDPVIEYFGPSCSTSFGCILGGEYFVDNISIGQEYYFKVYSKAFSIGKGKFGLAITTPPQNYTCDYAIPVMPSLSDTCSSLELGSNISTGINNAVWYKFTPTNAFHIIRVLAEGNYKYISVYNHCDSLPLTSSEYNESFLAYNQYVPDSTYYIKVEGIHGDLNFSQFNFSLCVLSKAINDEPSTAYLIQASNKCESIISGTTEGATATYTTGTCLPNGKDVWYKFYATKDYHKLTLNGLGNTVTCKFGLYSENDLTNPILCVTGNPFNHEYRLENLDSAALYFLRINAQGVYRDRAQFTLCLSSPPKNDNCESAEELKVNFVHICIDEKTGTTKNATVTNNEVANITTFGYHTKPNVWYKLVDPSLSMVIKVEPLTAGFDPIVRFWTKVPDSLSYSSNQCVYYSFQDIYSKSDKTHHSYQAEILEVIDLPPGKEYLIEVAASDSSIVSEGDFKICVIPGGSITTLQSVESETYRKPLEGSFDSVPIDSVAAGSLYNPIHTIKIRVSGASSPIKINNIYVSLDGTTNLSDIHSIGIFHSPMSGIFEWPFYNQEGYSSDFFNINENSNQFGQFQKDIKSEMVFIDEVLCTGFSGNNGTHINDIVRYFFIVVNLKCDIADGNVIKIKCTGADIDGQYNICYQNAISDINIRSQEGFYTVQDGSWTNPSTWVCNAVPPNGPNILPIHIMDNVYLDDTIQCGSVDLFKDKTLLLRPESMLTLGESSMGINTGNSNKTLSAYKGKLMLDNATLNVNGAMYVGNYNSQQYFDGIDKDTVYQLKLNNETIAVDTNKTMIDVQKFCIVDGVVSNFTNQNQTSQHSKKKHLILNEVRMSRAIRNLPEGARDYKVVHLDRKLLEEVRQANEPEIEIEFHNLNRSSHVYPLKISSVFSKDVVLRSSSKANIQDLDLPVIYTSIENERDRSALFSVDKSGLVGLIIDGANTYALQAAEGENDLYIFFNTNQVEMKKFDCGILEAPTNDLGIHLDQLNKIKSRANEKCVNLYIEVDYDIYQDKGSIQNTLNFVSNLYGQVFFLMRREEISMEISEVFIWDTPSPFENLQTKEEVLSSFKDTKIEFQGDLAQLISYRTSGGLAYIDVLCHPEQKFKTSFASIYGAFDNVPFYSWSIYVVTHELGHNFGSRHTHDCVWNGNNTAIDNCEPTICFGGALPPTGGTIMSYCHLTPVGVNFSYGFGIQPGDLIRQKLSNSDCISSCAENNCESNDVRLLLNLDNRPQDTYWTLRDDEGKVIYKSATYTVGNAKPRHRFCLEDGCYYFTMYDDLKKNPWELIGINSTINIDGNDGTVMGSNTDGFNLFTPKIFTSNLNINILDPSAFLYNARSAKNVYLSGKVSFGGGDDTIPNFEDGGFKVYFGGNFADDGGSGSSYLIPDTIVIGGGMATDHRETYNKNNEQIVSKNFIINASAEYRGGTTLFGNLINNGLYTQGLSRKLAFCGDVSYTDYFMNTKNSQSISGTGFFRQINTPIPFTQSQNYINDLHIANTYSGVYLNMPLGVRNVLRLRSDIHNGHNLFTLGDSTSNGTLITMPADVWSQYGSLPFDTIMSLQAYDGGYIDGMMRRWFNGKTTNVFYGIFPIADSSAHHPVLLKFDNTNLCNVTMEYVDSVPSFDGIPVGSEQNTTINNLSPNGYWITSATNNTGKYRIAANAHDFTEDGVKILQDLNSVRLIRTDSTGGWHASESKTLAGPTDLNYITSDSLIHFGNFGIGNGNCKYVINENDANLGSLRYAIDSCSSSGDTIYFLSALDTIHLSTDTIVINKNLTLDFNHMHKLVVDGSYTSTVLMITSGSVVHIKNMQIMAPNGNTGPALLNKGSLKLENSGVLKTNGINGIINQGVLEIIGPNFIKVN